MTDRLRKIPVVFYSTRGGREVVRDWLRGLEEEDRHAIGQDLMRVQYRWPIGMPLCRPMGEGLWEVRSDLSGNRIARVLFCFREGFLSSTALSRRRVGHRAKIWRWRAGGNASLMGEDIT
jgi:hypothetical protein